MSAYNWKTSSYCAEGDSCLNVAAHHGWVKLTESSDPTRSILTTTQAAWSALLRTLKENHRG